MGMGTRQSQAQQEEIWIGNGELARSPGHPFYQRVNELLDAEKFDVFIEGLCRKFYAPTLEASAAMRSIVRRDTGESYEEFLTGPAKASGVVTPTRDELARLDRKRKKRTSNKEWKSPTYADARITKMKDGRTHLAHKAEHVVDLDTGAVVAVTLLEADKGDTTTLDVTLCEAGAAVYCCGHRWVGSEARRAEA